MESTSTAMKIHISESTKKFLPANYKVTERGEIEVKGKGSMKTYWLEFREKRGSPQHPPDNTFDPLTPVKAIEYNYDRRMSMPQYMLHNKTENSVDERRVYSPVTFEEVAKRSVINSPVRNIFSGHGRVSRSNSTGHAYLKSPSDVFGDLITDTEEFLEDLHRRNSATTSVFTPLSSPAYSHSSKHHNKNTVNGQVKLLIDNFYSTRSLICQVLQFTEEEIALLNQKKPSPSAPPSNEKNVARSSKSNLKSNRVPDEAESQKKALQNLDQMVKNIYETGN